MFTTATHWLRFETELFKESDTSSGFSTKNCFYKLLVPFADNESIYFAIQRVIYSYSTIAHHFNTIPSIIA